VQLSWAYTILGLKDDATPDDINLAYQKFRKTVDDFSGAPADDDYLSRHFPDVVAAYTLLMANPYPAPVEVLTEAEEVIEPQSKIKTLFTYVVTFIVFIMLIAFLHQLAFFTL
jgi:hypothetical protein